MRILIVTSSLPYPPASGGAIRVHGIVEGLRRAGYEVTLLAFHDGPPDGVPAGLRVETLPAPAGRSRGQRLRDLLLTRQPDIAGRLYSPTFGERLRDVLRSESYDLVQFEGIESVCYLPVAQEARPDLPRIFDTFNAEYALQHNIYQIDRQNPRRWPVAAYSWIQSRRIRHYEREMSDNSQAVIAVSPEDQALLRDLPTHTPVHVVPSGIWVDHYQEPVAPLAHIQPDTLVFTGKMDYRPNVDAMLWFTQAILPRIREQVSDAQLVIVGQKPHAMLEPLRHMPGVTLTGWVDSVVPYLRAAAVYIAPLRMGSGTRLKLLEAMACDCAAVVTTTASAGLLDEARQAMRLADDADTFASAVVELLRDPQRRRELGAAAQQQVRQHYDWPVIIPRLLDVYRASGL